LIYKKGVSVLAYKVYRCLLLELLNKKDMTQTELAEIMGVKVQQINKYVLKKQKMSYEVAKNISVILNCQMDELYEWVIE
jgi:plasmid maintenance system antidote protein VapI